MINTSGATVTKGGYPTVQFSKTYPQSGVAGAARYVKANNSTTSLNTALTTTGTVDVTLGTLALGGDDRIPNTVPVIIRPGGKLDIKARNDTVGILTMDGGTLTGTSGTLTVSEIDWYGGTVSANVTVQPEPSRKKGGAPWSPSANITYTGDTIIESGALKLLPGGPSLPGTGRILLSSGTVLDLNGTSRSLSLADLPQDSAIRTGTGTLTLTGSNSGAVAIAFSGNLVHAGSSLVTLSGPVRHRHHAHSAKRGLTGGRRAKRRSADRRRRQHARARRSLHRRGNFDSGGRTRAAPDRWSQPARWLWPPRPRLDRMFSSAPADQENWICRQVRRLPSHG